MLRKKPHEDKYRHLINKLGFSNQLIADAGILKDQYKALYCNLIRVENNLCLIKQSWQLALFAESEKTFKDLVELIDGSHAQFIHYAALAGNLNALKWADQHHPQWFDKKQAYSSNGIRFAFMSNDPDTMDYFFDNHKALFYHYRKIIFPLIKSANQLKWVLNNNPKIIEAEAGTPNLSKLIEDSVINEDIPSLQAMFDYSPCLFDEFNDPIAKGATIADLAARKGSTLVLDWIDEQMPELLKPNNKMQGVTIGHYAAVAGSVKSLDWILANQSRLLGVIIKNKSSNLIPHKSSPILDFPSFRAGNHIGIYVAKSDNPDAADWVGEHIPYLMFEKNAAGLNVVDHAFIKEKFNASIVDKVLKILNQRHTIKFEADKYTHYQANLVLDNLNQYLEDNYEIRSIFNFENLCEHAEEKYIKKISFIKEKLERNNNLALQMRQCFRQGKNVCHPEEKPSKEQVKLLKNDFFKHVLSDIPRSVAETKFKHILNKLQPEQRFSDTLKKIIGILDNWTERYSKKLDGCQCISKNEYKKIKNELITVADLGIYIIDNVNSMSELREAVVYFYAHNQHSNVIYQYPPHQGFLRKLFDRGNKRSKKPPLMFKTVHHELRISEEDLERESENQLNNIDFLQGEYSLTEIGIYTQSTSKC